MCVRVCRFRSNVSLKPLPQNVHRYRFMSEWHFMWRFRRRCSVNAFEQIWQANLFGSSSAMGTGVFLPSPFSLWPCTFSTASGFLKPWPPFTNSSCTSGGNPNCEEINTIIRKAWNAGFSLTITDGRNNFLRFAVKWWMIIKSNNKPILFLKALKTFRRNENREVCFFQLLSNLGRLKRK